MVKKLWAGRFDFIAGRELYPGQTTRLTGIKFDVAEIQFHSSLFRMKMSQAL